MPSEKSVLFSVTEADEGLRLDQALSKADFIVNRSQALKLIKAGKVTFKDQPLRASHTVTAGEVFKIYLPVKNPLSISKKFVECLYEDEEVLVINKPSGLVVHPAPGHETDTLINRLIHTKKLSAGTAGDRPGLVHRLDKDASGLLVLAKTATAQAHLIAQFVARQVKRIYWVITLKTPEPAENRIETYLSRHPKKRQVFISTKTPCPGSKEAITFYKVLQSHPLGPAWLECRLKTGRTHQIRIHLASLGCPVIGDKAYGSWKGMYSKKNQALFGLCSSLKGMALHAHTLAFVHPATQKELCFTLPWPEDIKKLAEAAHFKSIPLRK